MNKTQQLPAFKEPSQLLQYLKEYAPSVFNDYIRIRHQKLIQQLHDMNRSLYLEKNILERKRLVEQAESIEEELLYINELLT